MDIFKVREEKVDLEDATGNLKSAILSYIPFLNLIPYFKKTDSEFVEYHAKEGTTLFIIELIYGMLCFIFTRIKVSKCSWGVCTRYIPLYITIPLIIIFLLVFSLNIVGLYNVIMKKKRTLPIIGNLF